MPGMKKKETKHLSIEEQEIVSCLDCWKGVQVIRNYAGIFQIVQKEYEIRSLLRRVNRKYESNKDAEDAIRKAAVEFGLEGDFEEKYEKLKILKTVAGKGDVFKKITDRQGREKVEMLSELLGLEGEMAERYDIIKRLSSHKVKDCFDMEKFDKCLVCLQKIIAPISEFYAGENGALDVKHAKQKFIFSEMNNINKRYGYTSEKGEKALRLYSDRKNMKDDAPKGFLDIFNIFCSGYNRERFGIGRGRVCEAVTFLRTIADIDPEEYAERDGFYKRVDTLSDGLGKIMEGFLRNAPKKVGNTLRVTMEKVGMRQADLYNVLKDCTVFEEKYRYIENKEGNIRRDLKHCTEPDMPEKEMREKILPLICRALLISEDVLYKGQGKKYVAWSDLLDDEGLEVIGEKTEEKGKKNRKMIVHRGIADIVKMEEGKLLELLRECPVLFQEEDFNAYEYHECFDNLLHKEEAFALLEVLERMEKENV